MITIRILFLSFLFLIGCCRQLLADEQLLLIGKPISQAAFVSTKNDGTLVFRIEDKKQNVAAQQLIRWSSPRYPTKQDFILLTGGSRLMLADSWSGLPAWQLKEGKVIIISRLFGKVMLSRNQVRAVVLQAPLDLQAYTRFLDQLSGKQEKNDTLLLTNGDQWSGQLTDVSFNSTKQQTVSWQLNSTADPLKVPKKKVVAIKLGSLPTAALPKGKYVIGCRDGSLLRAKSLVTDADQLRIELTGGEQITGSDVRDIVSLQSLASKCSYLSDLDEVEYQHVPYLEIPWKFRQDRNVLGGPLRANGCTYSKGLGMHTAGRLTYRLDVEEIATHYRHFRASVAIDDAAIGGGSAIFRVYLEQGKQWQSAFTSPIMRGGSLPVPISVELGSAKQLALVVDFADRGDERDYANWIDARLE